MMYTCEDIVYGYDLNLDEYDFGVIRVGDNLDNNYIRDILVSS
jgi:hypothetical protein